MHKVLEQTKHRGYHITAKYQANSQPITMVGVCLSTQAEMRLRVIENK
jgi:hypothetical protein